MDAATNRGIWDYIHSYGGQRGLGGVTVYGFQGVPYVRTIIRVTSRLNVFSLKETLM